jgi:nitric oxide reductase NorD protein
VPSVASERRVARPTGGVSYPEWDYTVGAYRQRVVTVRQERAPETDSAWADRVLAEHAPLVRKIRERFERLRARRSRLTGQRDGEELDLAACVRALVDMKTGHSADDRLYIDVRPARRALAIALLVDISGSTDTPVNPLQQVIDVEKEAVLLASAALDALGDRYLVLTFSGNGADDVRLGTVKDFDEPNGDAVRRRIAAMTPRGNTRLGAAVRHATALLAREAAGHRLLLIVSDGRPNDVEWYGEEYGVEDTRQAINEARASGVFPFCLTVDREGAEYLPRIFGAAGHTILRHPDQLPVALVAAVRGLVG